MDGDGEVPVEETSDTSPFAELIQRARDAMASGSQEDQDQILAEVDTQLTVSSARADAADAQLAAVQGQTDAAQDKFLRLNAEFENFRKRSSKEKAEAINKAKSNVIQELLPVIDAFEAAAGQVKADTEGEQRIAGSYQGLYAKMVEAFKKMGLEVVPGVGTPFDPEVHEAIMRAPSDEVADGTVLQEFRRGFKIGGQLLRPAMVQVSYSEEGTAADADSLAKQAEHAGRDAGDIGEAAASEQ
jgi:molecular chaperone GrpE